MIKSLTGFGDIELLEESTQLNIIIRTVNSRFLDIKFRGIDLNPKLEMAIRQEIQNSLIRGSVQISINHKNGTKNNKEINFNRERYEQIETIINTIQTEYGRHVQLSELISLSDLVGGSESVEINDSILLKGVIKAIKQVEEMRKEEGNAISVDIKNRIDLIQTALSNIEKLSSDFVREMQIKYREKIISLLDDIKIDDDRLAQEIAINIDRLDFTEEIVRGRSHCEQLFSFLSAEEPVGKKMNFILQELSREVNTIGSKSPSSTISQMVVELKSEIEKIREQVQNIL